jgi:hypothetical protein
MRLMRLDARAGVGNRMPRLPVRQGCGVHPRCSPPAGYSARVKGVESLPRTLDPRPNPRTTRELH